MGENATDSVGVLVGRAVAAARPTGHTRRVDNIVTLSLNHALDKTRAAVTRETPSPHLPDVRR